MILKKIILKYRVNSITFLCAILLIGDCNHRNETVRLEALFALVDFNNGNQISPDELVIYFILF